MGRRDRRGRAVCCASGPSGWLVSQPLACRPEARFGVLDLSRPYRKSFNDVRPEVMQVADRFHVTMLANTELELSAVAG